MVLLYSRQTAPAINTALFLSGVFEDLLVLYNVVLVTKTSLSFLDRQIKDHDNI